MGAAAARIAFVFLAAAQVAAARIEELRVVGRGEIADLVRVEDVERVGDMVRARLANLSDYRLENPRLIVAESFRWKNEMHPGPDDPSRADVVTLPDVIAPHGSLVVTHTFSWRPERTDGWFETSVEVVGIDRYPEVIEPVVTTPVLPPE